MHSSPERSTSRLFNAFSEPFLRLDAEADEPDSGVEPEGEGPWLLLPYSTPEWPSGHGMWPLGESPERGDRPAAAASRRTTALLASVARRIVGREPFYQLGEERWQDGYPLLRHGQVQAWLGIFHPEWALTSGAFERVVRSPLDLAILLEVAGPTARERAGAILYERLAGNSVR